MPSFPIFWKWAKSWDEGLRLWRGGHYCFLPYCKDGLLPGMGRRWKQKSLGVLLKQNEKKQSCFAPSLQLGAMPVPAHIQEHSYMGNIFLLACTEHQHAKEVPVFRA